MTGLPRAFDSLSVALAERYAIERELGRGGMATVYLAEDLKLHRRVALKVLRPELAASLGTERFHREVEIAAQLSHPHILPLHDSGEAGGYLYYAMPYVEGESLRQRLEREGQLPIAEVIAIVRAVASALTYAHQQGIIHRDIKPENILLAAATWLIEAGDTAQAARLLIWHQSTAVSGWEASFTYAVTPLAYLMLARIEEAQGNIRLARAHYKQFLRRYDMPMPRQRYLVDEAKAALTRLSGAEPTGTR